MDDISSRIKKRREELGYTQAYVAKKIGVTRVAVTKWENGATANLKLPNLIKLCELFGFSVEYLINGDEESDKTKAALAQLINTNLNNLKMDQIEIIQDVTRVKEENRPHLKKVVKTYLEEADEQRESNKK